MITINTKLLKKVEKQLGTEKRKAPIALSRALNRAASKVKTAASKETRKEYVLKAKDINATIKIAKASQKRLGAVVLSKGAKLPLDKYRFTPKQPRPKKPPKSLKVAVRKNGLKELIGAFVADIQGNKIFKRTSKSRLPIRRLFGPAIPQLVGVQKIRPEIEKQAVDTFHKRLDHEIKRIREGN
jgi:hypothetical protein